ncbi:MAG: hypothetical protein ACD_48C00184G0002 [uncultured bacterium]|uniref:Methyltransferase small domain superfamily n=3 Tax=Candidatus Roizmaniibacteriota TaxID=1752723 RepID=A0A0G0X1T0_9BACT|nr:MAG: hypothetical protein ACD_48C00184G0002 [uncultured bacterium]KKR71546.1 MAG: Methyltransferase small domain superfamily [Candidatus Roizmanbacteria bacterium GW2011_GWB1_40_7]KKR94222.1 MAG: Methyltransferase small domain superfamily [Candidatus Roizmanbacteria bacterium GW2011_GWA1_41_13]KKS18965.1 MAG: Methyltransferase small domain superfamily [Candidatus Roizmanbacteria bacterium GW2011_GWC2_41_7]KKS24754.1 MAG: methyltransferase domain-containing protein, 3-demethylubiquinone-9 3-m
MYSAKDFYNQFWNNSEDGHFHDFHFKWPLVQDLVKGTKKINVLDYGCGDGSYIEGILKVNPKIKPYGIDISKIAINRAHKNIPNGTFFVQGDDKKIPLKNKSIDLVLAMDVIEHVFYADRVINEFGRIIKPGGTLFLSTPYHGLIKNLLISLRYFDQVFDPTKAHIRFFTKKTLYKLLNNAGFNVIKSGYYGRFYPIPRAMYVVCEKVK